MNRYTLPGICLLLCISCKKDFNSYPYVAINTPASVPIRDVEVKSLTDWVICGGNEGAGIILNTYNGGNSWTPASAMFENSINCLYFTGSSIGYAADSDILIYKTTDGGINWNPFYGTSWPLTVNRNLRDIWFTNDSTGFVCGGKNFGNGVLFTTQNSGDHWFFREFDHEYRGICFAGSQHGIMCGYGSVLITNNGGVSFRSSGLTKGYYTGCAVDSYGNYWLCSFNGDVLFSSNLGESWSVMRKGDSWGTQQGNFTTIAVHPNGAVVCAGPNGFISWTTDGGNSWASYESFGGTSVHVVKFISENEIIAAGANGKLFKLSL